EPAEPLVPLHRRYRHQGCRGQRPQSHLANLRLAQAFPKVRERTTSDAAQPACCVLGLAFFIDATGLEFREPSAEFGQLGRREPQDRFLDIFDCHSRRNSTPASELEEPVAGKPGCNCLSAAGDRGWQTRSAPTETDYVAGVGGLELRNVDANLRETSRILARETIPV